MVITWEALGALCAFAAAVSALLINSARLMIRSSLLESEKRLMDELEKRYVKAERCQDHYSEVLRRLDALEQADT